MLVKRRFFTYYDDASNETVLLLQQFAVSVSRSASRLSLFHPLIPLTALTPLPPGSSLLGVAWVVLWSRRQSRRRLGWDRWEASCLSALAYPKYRIGCAKVKWAAQSNLTTTEIRSGEVRFTFVGTHEEVRRFLRHLR